MAKVGDNLGGYRLIRLIGSGGLGEVFAASKGEGVAEVAVKVIKTSRSKKRARFIQEIRVHVTLSSQQAPNILQIIDHNLEGIEGGEVPGFIVMPMAKLSLDEAIPLLQGRRSRIEPGAAPFAARRRPSYDLATQEAQSRVTSCVPFGLRT